MVVVAAVGNTLFYLWPAESSYHGAVLLLCFAMACLETCRGNHHWPPPLGGISLSLACTFAPLPPTPEIKHHSPTHTNTSVAHFRLSFAPLPLLPLLLPLSSSFAHTSHPLSTDQANDHPTRSPSPHHRTPWICSAFTRKSSLVRACQ